MPTIPGFSGRTGNLYRLKVKFDHQSLAMKRSSFLLILFTLSFFSKELLSQTRVSIPAYTGYAVPAEKSDEEDESELFSAKEGIHNWTDREQQVQFWFRIRHKGNLQVALWVRSNDPGNMLSVKISGKGFKITVPQSKEFRLVKVGSLIISDTGFYSLTLASAAGSSKGIAAIRSLELNGEAVKDIHFNAKSRRNAASVHLMYPVADSIKITSFYNEITVPKDADPLYSYYMACGFARGYFGIQVNSETERRVIFSVWDAGNEAVDRNKVTEENRVKLIAKGEEVVANDFGNEGTGGHSHLVYNWRPEETYRFLVTCATDSATNSTTYAGYFFIPEMQKWKFIAAFKAPKDGKPLRRLYSFLENFGGTNGQVHRKAYFGNQWIRRENGQWIELTKSNFSYDATAKAGDRLDYGGGAESDRFYLWNGGFKDANALFNQEFIRKETGNRPQIDLYKNADSAVQMDKDIERMAAAVRDGKFDTTGSNENIYYKILKEGDGDLVRITDTVVVNYKGWLMDGPVFDQTKDKPATFPLKRLIKGWQAGLPFCRQGGKIRLIIPSASGYSIRNLGTIPPNSILVFDIEVLEIKRSK